MQKLSQNPRILFFLLFLTSIIGTAYALYLEYALQLLPCNLCILQRIGLWVMGLFSLIFAIINPKNLGIKIALWIGSFIGIVWSLAIAARHTWMIYLPPDQVPACGASIDYLMQTVPALEALKMVLNASGECAAVTWRLFGLSIPEQSLVFFAVLTLVHIWLLFLFFKKKSA